MSLWLQFGTRGDSSGNLAPNKKCLLFVVAESWQKLVNLIMVVFLSIKIKIKAHRIWQNGWSLDESVLLNAMDSDDESLQNGDEPLVCNMMMRMNHL